MLYMSEEQVRALCEKTGQTIPKKQRGEATGKKSKYGNIKTEVDGQMMDSRHEAECYRTLQLQVRGGEIRAVMCQVPFLLPGGVTYKADFVALNNDGTYTVFDAKSAATRKDKVYRIKRRLMQNCLNIEITEI